MLKAVFQQKTACAHTEQALTDRKSTMKSKARIEKLIDKLSEGLYERREIIAVSLLGALAGQNTFLYGPPGTAKSLISRRISCAFEDAVYFEHLMNRFSAPEEVFGPVSLKSLKEDQYKRKTEGYLPKATFAFLDEIWKSSPAILNTLLTIINERTFKNGGQVSQVPLKALISASNEIPQPNQGLEAIYDRFSIRMPVEPMRERANFEALLQGTPTKPQIKIDSELVIKTAEWEKWQTEMEKVTLSEESLTIIKLIREELAANYKKLQIYVSDRRWQRAALLMKAAAFFCGRKTTNHSDALLLRHCIWTTPENRKKAAKIVEKAVQKCGLTTEANIQSIDEEKEQLDREINSELYHTEDIYKSLALPDGKKYFKAVVSIAKNYGQSTSKTIYISEDYFKTKEEFHPITKQGKQIEWIRCTFEGQGTCKIGYDRYEYAIDSLDSAGDVIDYVPPVLFNRGDAKEDINIRLLKSFANDISIIKTKLENAQNEITKQLLTYEETLKTPFVTAEDQKLSVVGIARQCDEIAIRTKDCERLLTLCTQGVHSPSSLSNVG